MSSKLYKQCIVCGRQLEDSQPYGERHYCDLHIFAFSDDMPSVWRSAILSFGILLLMVVAVGILSALTQDGLHELIRMGIGVAATMIPAASWLFFLYRGEANQKTNLPTLLPTIFLLSVLIAAAVIRPLLFDLIDFNAWLSRTNATNRFLGNILLAGFLHTFVLYALTRYTVWRTPTFTHRMHGILFGLTAAWGYGSTLSLLFALDQGSLILPNGVLRLITQICPFLTSGLILGFYLGRNRFEDLGFHYLSMGIILSSVLTGGLLYAGNELNNTGLGLTQDAFSPLPGLVLNLVVMLLTFGAVYGLMQRHNTLTKARLEHRR